MAGSGTAQLRRHDEALLRVENLTVEYALGRGAKVHAVSDVSFDVAPGETLGLVGESGCGKSTTGRALLRLVPPTAGTVVFDGRDITALGAAELRALRPAMQIIFQDPISSLNPRRRVRDIVAEPLRIWGRFDDAGGDARLAEILDAVGLDIRVVGDRRPRSFSGGQAQRVCIARALVAEPKLVVCDEPVSALDVSVQAQILNLLKDMKDRYGLTLLFISHDLAVIRNISDRIAVMYLGKLCEIGDASGVYTAPAHPYTAALMDAILEPDPTKPISPPPLAGEVSSAVNPPSGCRFRPRCLYASERCAIEEPTMRPVGGGRFVACHYPLVPIQADAGGPTSRRSERADHT